MHTDTARRTEREDAGAQHGSSRPQDESAERAPAFGPRPTGWSVSDRGRPAWGSRPARG